VATKVSRTTAIKRERHHPRGGYWHAASLFVASLIQKKMQTVPKKKGHTVLVMDDNKAMPALSDAIYDPTPGSMGCIR
jgi:hypothetical protein